MNSRTMDAIEALEPASGGEPAEGARTWYRHRTSGQLGFLVDQHGVPCIQYDRNAEVIIVAFKPDEWVPDVDERPLLKGSVAQIAQAADQHLCKALGLVQEARKGWMELSEVDRRVFLSGKGPTKPRIRQRVYRGIWDELSKYAR